MMSVSTPTSDMLRTFAMGRDTGDEELRVVLLSIAAGADFANYDFTGRGLGFSGVARPDDFLAPWPAPESIRKRGVFVTKAGDGQYATELTQMRGSLKPQASLCSPIGVLPPGPWRWLEFVRKCEVSGK